MFEVLEARDGEFHSSTALEVPGRRGSERRTVTASAGLEEVNAEDLELEKNKDKLSAAEYRS